MNTFKTLALPIVLLMWLLFIYMSINFIKDANQDLLTKRLDIAVNYSIDAAVDEMLYASGNLGLDYADWEYVNIDPQIAYDTFVSYFMKNWGLGDVHIANGNRQMVETSWLPCFCVATYDGYYLWQPMYISDASTPEYRSVCSVKLPYTYKDGNVLYALNLGFKDAKRFNGFSVEKVITPISNQDQSYLVSSTISDAVQSVVYNQLGANVSTTFYIPSELTTFSRTNPIRGVTAFAYVSGVYDGVYKTDDVFAIGGARLAHEQFVGCYYEDGIPYYSYYKNIPQGTNIIQTFETAEMAAEHGWYYNPKYVGHEIWE